MNHRDKSGSSDPGFDGLDVKINQAMKEEGAIIPTTVEDVRHAKARLKARPVTVPPHLRDASTIVMKHKGENLVEKTENIIPCAALFNRANKEAETSYKATEEFVEAVAIAQITRLIATPAFPLGHLRQNKMVYFAHRKAEEDVSEHFLKQAAGPYSPWAKYQGPEKIAQQNGYVKRSRVGNLVGFVTGNNIEKIDRYLSRYPVCIAVDWVVSKFRYRKKEELELLATVDFAALELIRSKKAITMENAKQVIATSKEWTAKLEREIFSDDNINRALAELKILFPKTYL
jgi:type I restriction enzyme S subunit